MPRRRRRIGRPAPEDRKTPLTLDFHLITAVGYTALARTITYTCTAAPTTRHASAEGRKEGGVDEERAEESEQDRSVAHEDGEVRSGDGDAVEGGEPVGPGDADEREEVDDADDDERSADEVGHRGVRVGVSHGSRVGRRITVNRSAAAR
jgi:hypothetical protein